MKQLENNYGIIASVYNKTGVVELSNGDREHFLTKSNKIKLVVGDYVLYEQLDEKTLLITEILESRNQLMRLNTKGHPQAVASNLTQILLIIAPQPTPNLLLIDQFILISELMNCSLSIIFNKIDIIDESHHSFRIYEDLGYRLVKISAKYRTNLDHLFNLLNHQTTILLGQSGVGKSTITNLLIGDTFNKTDILSTKTKKGRHTTSAITMHRILENGYLIDTPGIENLRPNVSDIKEIENGFREINLLSERCKFRNCIHINEPDCAIKKALKQGKITIKRYNNYKKLIAEFEIPMSF
jgi:ribosome biogenesis GTPase